MADEPGDCTCGGTIPRARRDGFCSSWCATRDAQGLPPQTPPRAFVSGSGDGVVSPPAPSTPDGPPENPDDPDEPRRPRYRLRRRLIADEVEARLAEAGLLGHWQAATVLDLADSLDWTGGSGSARSALHRELARQMGELLRGQDEAGSSVGAMRDEVAERRARREARRAGGA